VASVEFWDHYAQWYQLWIEHTHYHDGILEILLSRAKPGWRILDIGAGNGVLSFPLSSYGCNVTALEPSAGMRNLLYESGLRHRSGRITVDDRMWEEVSNDEFSDYDLILACNSLHLTTMGFEKALEKIFRTRPQNIFLISEIDLPEIQRRWLDGAYSNVLLKSTDVHNPYAYHHLDEMVRHWTFIKGRSPQPNEIADLKKKIVLKDGHLWIEHTSRMMMFWWRRNGCNGEEVVPLF